MAALTNINFWGRDSAGCSLLILFYTSVVPSLIIAVHAGSYHVDGSWFYNESGTWCSIASYYRGSVFESNLNTVMYSLVQNTSKTGFSTSIYGQTPNQVYGLLQCRGDTTVDQCYNCSRKAATTIQQSQVCGNAISGRIWLDLCYLHYDNSSFFGQLDFFGWFFSKLENASSPDVFNTALQELVRELSAEAAYRSSNRYASGTTNDSFFPKIYALVQCTRDLSTNNCTQCLEKASSNIEANYSGRNGVQYLWGSCIISYEIYSFYTSASPAEAPAATPVADTRRSPLSPEAPSSNKPVATSSSSNNKHSIKIPTILGIVGGLLLALLVCVFTTRIRRLKAYEVQEQVVEHIPISEDRQIVTLKMETLLAATENFHDDNKLGEGGFGSVYKGITHDGKEIAVKKLSLNSMQGKKEFLTEVKIVAQIQHRNLVKLLGCCAEGSEKLLIYEYLHNSSLDKILFDPIKRKELDWQMRYNIIMGVARGLLYLHEDSQPRIIHRDIKASNILLDDKLNPKIADFGLAKLFPDDESCICTQGTKVAGTIGYMAPEYAMHGQLSAKADVYSFGVLLLELVTGRKNMDYNLSPEMHILLRWAWGFYEGGKSVEIIDPESKIESCDEEQALRCIQVGFWCTQADSSLRPPMSTVTLMLSSHFVMLPDLTKPAFVNSVSQINRRFSSSGSGLTHASATTSSASSDLVPPPSKSRAYSIELVSS